MVYLAHAAECCRVQHNQGRLFGLEHPASATSWKQDVITDLAALPGVYAVTFDQCMLGLKSPSGRPDAQTDTHLDKQQALSGTVQQPALR